MKSRLRRPHNPQVPPWLAGGFVWSFAVDDQGGRTTRTACRWVRFSAALGDDARISLIDSCFPSALPGCSSRLSSPESGMVQKQVTPQGWLGSTPAGRRPQIRGFRAGGSLAVASSTPATQLLSPAKMLKLNHAEKPGLQPGGWRFDPARLHSMLNDSDRITSHLLLQRPKFEPSALNPTRAPSSFLRHLRHLRHCVIPIEAKPHSREPTCAPSSSLRHRRHLRHLRRHLRHCVIPIEAKPPATNRLAHYHRHCVIGVIYVICVVICVIASYRSKPIHQPRNDLRTIIVAASSASYRSKPTRQPRSDACTIKDRVWME